MSFLILFGMTIVLAILVSNWGVIRRTYFGKHGARNSLALLLALVSAALSAASAFSLRWLYLPSTDETPHWWRALQGLDAFVLTLSLVLCGGLFFYFKSWYRYSPMRRFMAISSLQTFIIGASGLLRMRAVGGNLEDIWMWAALALAGLAALVICAVRCGKQLVQDLREFSRSLED